MRISLTLDEQTTYTLRLKAATCKQSLPRYLTEMARAEARTTDDELACEGYSYLSLDTPRFARDAIVVANNDW